MSSPTVAEVASVESEREMRVKLEKLLEVQAQQVELQKELRVKTESLLKLEQQNSSRLRQQVDDLRRGGGPANAEQGPAAAADPGASSRALSEALERIKALEKQLGEARSGPNGVATETPEDTEQDRVESHLRAQLEEQEILIKRLRSEQFAEGTRQASQQSKRPGGPSPEGETVRLQLLLQSRDRQLDELTQNLRRAESESADVKAEADVLKYEVRSLRKEVADRSEEMERQLHTEQQLRQEVFHLQDSLKHKSLEHIEETRRCAGFAQTATQVEDALRRAKQLEQQLQEVQTSTEKERRELTVETGQRLEVKDQVLKNQKATIESLTRELKEKDKEIEKLHQDADRGKESPGLGRVSRLRALPGSGAGGILPPLQSPSPVEDMMASARSAPQDGSAPVRSIDSYQRQLKAKDSKLAKQTERLQALTEMLEKRDVQLEELSSAKKDREGMRQRLNEMEDVLKAQPRAATRAEAERRLIEQEQRMRDLERQIRELADKSKRDEAQKESLDHDVAQLRSALAEKEGTPSQREEVTRLGQELAESQRLLEGRTEELRRARVQGTQESCGQDDRGAAELAAPGALARRLQKLEDLDKGLSRDVAGYLKDQETKIESLTSTIALLRSSRDEKLRQCILDGQTPRDDDGAGVPTALETQGTTATVPKEVSCQTDFGTDGVSAPQASLQTETTTDGGVPSPAVEAAARHAASEFTAQVAADKAQEMDAAEAMARRMEAERHVREQQEEFARERLEAERQWRERQEELVQQRQQWEAEEQERQAAWRKGIEDEFAQQRQQWEAEAVFRKRLEEEFAQKFQQRETEEQERQAALRKNLTEDFAQQRQQWETQEPEREAALRKRLEEEFAQKFQQRETEEQERQAALRKNLTEDFAQQRQQWETQEQEREAALRKRLEEEQLMATEQQAKAVSQPAVVPGYSSSSEECASGLDTIGRTPSDAFAEKFTERLFKPLDTIARTPSDAFAVAFTERLFKPLSSAEHQLPSDTGAVPDPPTAKAPEAKEVSCQTDFETDSGPPPPERQPPLSQPAGVPAPEPRVAEKLPEPPSAPSPPPRPVPSSEPSGEERPNQPPAVRRNTEEETVVGTSEVSDMIEEIATEISKAAWANIDFDSVASHQDSAKPDAIAIAEATSEIAAWIRQSLSQLDGVERPKERDELAAWIQQSLSQLDSVTKITGVATCWNCNQSLDTDRGFQGRGLFCSCRCIGTYALVAIVERRRQALALRPRSPGLFSA